jgi:nucleoid-associated protein YgaU
MVVFQGSRYANGEVVDAIGADGRRRRVLDVRRIPAAAAVHEHIVHDGDRLDSLATRFYNEPQKYWLILDANPDELNPFRLLRPGRRIDIARNRL